MKNRGKLLLILLVIVGAFVSCNGQSESKDVQEIKKVVHKKRQIIPLNNRDISRISEFIDTSLLSRYYDQIVAFEKDDSIHPSRKVDVVFSGSSSIRKWETLSDDMPGLKVINRGFGGSTVPEAIYYADVLFFKHHPEKIVFYSGDNDIGFQLWEVNQVIESYKYFYAVLRSHLPDTKIYFVSLKPSPGRMRYWPKMKKVNEFLKKFAGEHENCFYIDGASCFLDEKGDVKKEYFIYDGVHLNKAGYKLWSKIIYNEIKN